MSPKAGPIVTVARWSARHPWWAMTLWVVVVVASMVGGQVAGTTTLDEGQEGNGDSALADNAITASSLKDPVSENVLIRRRDGQKLQTQDTAVATEVSRAIDELPSTGEITPPARSENGSAALVSWNLTTAKDPPLDTIVSTVDGVAKAHPDLRVELVGDLSIEKALNDTLGDDLVSAEKLSIPITLAILLVAFGALIAAVVPLLLAMSCVLMAGGLTAVASQFSPVSDAINSVILLIGLAVGVDYSMFFLRRAREERALGRTPRDSVDIASQTAGRAVVLSGVTVLVAMSGMFISGNSVFTSFAVGTMIVVGAAIIGSITVLPALAGRLGTKIDRPRVPFLHRFSDPARGSRMWTALLKAVLHRPLVSLLLASGAMLALAVPALDMKTKLLGSADLPRSIPVMQTYDALTTAFPSEGSAHIVVLRATDVTSPASTAAIADLGKRVEESDNFGLTGPPEVRTSDDRTVAEILLPYPGADDSTAATKGLTELRDTIVPATLGTVGSAWVSGSAAGNRDFSDRLSERLPYVFAFVLGLTFLLMLLSFRSVPIAAITVLLNLLSVAAAYGLLVLVFQSEWAEGLLGFQSNGAIVSWLPLFLFVVLFGLSMDYHVFVLSRIREGVTRGLSTRDAIMSGITSSAGVVTSAAIVMVAVFGVFATLTTLEFKQLGIGLASAILIDATVIRGVLLPSALHLMGERAWHLPRWLHWLPSVGAEREAPQAAPST